MDIVDKLVDLRLDWTFEDYEEAYGDEWDYIPMDLKDCHETMTDYIRNTYDEALILECIENEE